MKLIIMLIALVVVSSLYGCASRSNYAIEELQVSATHSDVVASTRDPKAPTFEREEPNLTSELIQHDDRVSRLVRAGIALLFEEEYVMAITALELAAQITPEAETIYFVGFAYSKLKLMDRARNAFERSLSINPEFVPSLNGLAEIAFLEENFKESLELYSRSLSVDQEQPETWIQAGRAAWEIENEALAINFFENAIRRDNMLPEAWGALTVLYMSRGDWDSAWHALEQLFDLDPERANVLVDIINDV